MVGYVCNLSIQEVEAKGEKIQGQPEFVRPRRKKKGCHALSYMVFVNIQVGCTESNFSVFVYPLVPDSRPLMVDHHRNLPWLLGNFWVQVTVGDVFLDISG